MPLSDHHGILIRPARRNTLNPKKNADIKNIKNIKNIISTFSEPSPIKAQIVLERLKTPRLNLALAPNAGESIIHIELDLSRPLTFASCPRSAEPTKKRAGGAASTAPPGSFEIEALKPARQDVSAPSHIQILESSGGSCEKSLSELAPEDA